MNSRYAINRSDPLHPLRGCWAKIDRAREHLDTLKTVVSHYRRNPPRVSANQQLDPEDQSWIVKVRDLPDFGSRVATIAGDAVHNLRSALDSIVFELAFIDNEGVEKTGTGFPLLRTIDQWKDPGPRSAIKHLSKRHKALVLRHQPYKKARPIPHDALIRLTDLSNDDKHRLLQPMVFTAETIELQFNDSTDLVQCKVDFSRPIEMAGATELHKGTELLRLPITVEGPNPRVYVKVGMRGYETFRDRTHVVGAVEHSLAAVSDIADAFAAEFETPAALALREVVRYGRFPSKPLPFDYANLTVTNTSTEVT